MRNDASQKPGGLRHTRPAIWKAPPLWLRRVPSRFVISLRIKQAGRFAFDIMNLPEAPIHKS